MDEIYVYCKNTVKIVYIAKNVFHTFNQTETTIY